jgi:hypothetical protein
MPIVVSERRGQIAVLPMSRADRRLAVLSMPIKG